MNLTNIKTLLSNCDISADKVNPIIDSLSVQNLDELSELERTTLREMINNMLILVQDSSSGAHVNNPEKAKLLFNSLT
jgi:hypothetical protein